MLIMRMYALYGRSRKVLAFYIIITTVIVGGGGVSFSSIKIGISLLLSDIFWFLEMQWTLLGGKKETPRIVQVRIGCAANLSREK